MDFFLTLKKAGRKAAKAWLDQNWDDLGVRATIDLKKEYGERRGLGAHPSRRHCERSEAIQTCEPFWIASSLRSSQ